LLVAYIHPVYALLAPRRAGASAPRDGAFIPGRALPRPAFQRWPGRRTPTAIRARRQLASLRAGKVRALFAVDSCSTRVLISTPGPLPPRCSPKWTRCSSSVRARAPNQLDFIGQAHRHFRFDLRYRAVTATTRTEVEKQIQLGFPFLPAESICPIRGPLPPEQLDRVAQEIVLENLRTAIPSRRPAMVRELKALADARPGDAAHRITLAQVLQETGLEVEDVYRSGSWPDASPPRRIRQNNTTNVPARISIQIEGARTIHAPTYARSIRV
jgi:hypothetical protein